MKGNRRVQNSSSNWAFKRTPTRALGFFGVILQGLKVVGKILVGILVLWAMGFCLYVTWSWWENKQLQSFCGEVHPGDSASSLPRLAEKYGFNSRWVEADGIQESIRHR